MGNIPQKTTEKACIEGARSCRSSALLLSPVAIPLLLLLTPLRPRTAHLHNPHLRIHCGTARCGLCNAVQRRLCAHHAQQHTLPIVCLPILRILAARQRYGTDTLPLVALYGSTVMERPSAYTIPFAPAVAVVLLLCFCCTTVGTTLLFFALRQQVRKEVKTQLKEGVPDDQLTRFAFSRTSPPPGVQWIHEGEFRFYGQLYDIVRAEQRGDTTLYYCINDHAEQQLFANLDAAIRDTLGTSKSARATHSALKHLVFYALVPEQQYSFSFWKPQARTPCFMETQTHLHTPSIPTPPPWQLFPIRVEA